MISNSVTPSASICCLRGVTLSGPQFSYLCRADYNPGPLMRLKVQILCKH